MIPKNENICPRCGRLGLQRWEELSEADRDLASRLHPELRSRADKKSLRVCNRCWYESEDASAQA